MIALAVNSLLVNHGPTHGKQGDRATIQGYTERHIEGVKGVVLNPALAYGFCNLLCPLRVRSKAKTMISSEFLLSLLLLMLLPTLLVKVRSNSSLILSGRGLASTSVTH